MLKTIGYAAQNARAALAPFGFERREPGETDVLIEILYCGVCHTDIHQARDEWGGSIFPMVPGHEIVGRVTRVGPKAARFKPGDLAAVGCLVDSCRTCANCRQGYEQFCNAGPVFTYNSRERDGGTPTYGGYSNQIVVDEAFTLKVPAHLELSQVAPLLCAGITTYSPLRHWQVGEGKRVGVVGLGGLGHMGVKFARAFGAHVVVFTHSANKADDARRLGAHEVVVASDSAERQRHLGSLDFVLDTVSAPHDLNAYLQLLRRDGAMVLVGLPEKDPAIHVPNLIFGRHQLAGSLIGGIAETQSMLDYCGAHNIAADVELIPIQKINEAYDRMIRGDVKYRFVVDLKSLRPSGQ